MEVYLAIVGGLAFLVAGAEMLVRGAVAIARHFAVSPLLIGLTLVGFGTSTPEFVTSVVAGLEGSPGIAVGNIVGSNIANILLILGIAALIHPIRVEPESFRRDAVWVVAVALTLPVLVIIGGISRLAGVAMIATLVAYIIYVYHTEQTRPAIAHSAGRGMGEQAPGGPSRPTLAIALALMGIAMTILGANILVDSAITLARQLVISETVIGLTIVAVGTSLPEFVTSCVAAWRRQSDIAYGNIVGSNIYNILFILGVTALAQPIVIPDQISELDIWVMIAATGLLVFFGGSGFSISRLEGGAFILAYLAYVTYVTIGRAT